MFSSENANDWLERPFAPIGLAALNAKAGMLERIDNKYVVDSAVLRQAVHELSRQFDILEIGGKRAFAYETCYFDDAGLRSYFDHHQGRRKRIKVRTRRYLDAGLCFLEIKLKDMRGRTVKKRLAYDTEKYGTLDECALSHIRETYRGFYQEDFPHQLSKTLEMCYVRITLVAKEGRERMTIDNGLCFFAGLSTLPVGGEVFIVEAKSANGNGVADRILRRLHQHPTKHCSKYCAGTALLATGTKHNKFRPVLRKLGFPPGGASAAALP